MIRLVVCVIMDGVTFRLFLPVHARMAFRQYQPEA
jgi:hypothetical protein